MQYFEISGAVIPSTLKKWEYNLIINFTLTFCTFPLKLSILVYLCVFYAPNGIIFQTQKLKRGAKKKKICIFLKNHLPSISAHYPQNLPAHQNICYSILCNTQDSGTENCLSKSVRKKMRIIIFWLLPSFSHT